MRAPPFLMADVNAIPFEGQPIFRITQCKRCGFYFAEGDLVKEPQTGLLVDRECLDDPINKRSIQEEYK